MQQLAKPLTVTHVPDNGMLAKALATQLLIHYLLIQVAILLMYLGFCHTGGKCGWSSRRGLDPALAVAIWTVNQQIKHFCLLAK